MKRECGLNLLAPNLVLPHDSKEARELEESKEAERVRMGGRMGSQLKQLKEGQLPGNGGEIHKVKAE
jgi:hypothetical protein